MEKVEKSKTKPNSKEHAAYQLPAETIQGKTSLSLLIDSFTKLACAIEEQKDESSIQQLLAEMTQAIQQVLGRTLEAEQTPEIREWLPKLCTVVETWQGVWPRLGQQLEFRMAVVREARSWSRRFTAWVQDSR